MRVLPLLLLAAALFAQRLPQSKPIPVSPLDLSKIQIPVVHIHPIMHGSCKGQPDHVYGNSEDVYYACISGQDVCTVSKAHNGVGVPRALIVQYQQVKAALKAKRDADHERFEKERQQRQEQLVREGRSTGDPALDRALAQERSDRIAQEMRSARAEGRRPNLAQFSQPNAAFTGSSRGAAGTVEEATVRRTTTALLQDVKLEGIAAGARLDDVVEALGKPHSSISGESEQLTYRLESGGTARLVFERSVLVRIERRAP